MFAIPRGIISMRVILAGYHHDARTKNNKI